MRNFKLVALLFVGLLLVKNTMAQQAQPQPGPKQAASRQEPANYKAAIEQITAAYNKGLYENIFNLYGSDMQKMMPLERMKNYFKQISEHCGQLNSATFDNMRGSMAFYKVKFEKGTGSINIAIDSTEKIQRFALREDRNDSAAGLAHNKTPLVFPAKGEWTVDAKEQMQMGTTRAQKSALTLAVKDTTGKTYKTDGKANEDYFAYGQEITAPCDGEVVSVLDCIKDHVPGSSNPALSLGNYIIIKTALNEFVIFGHLKAQSLKVTEGQKIKQGKLIALCGNSGGSTEPGIYIYIQTTADMATAAGLRASFTKLLVAGAEKANYSPLRGEKIQPAKQ